MARRRGIALTRDDVIGTAIALLRDEGPPALGINRVARELGIKPPSLYHHVASNDDLHRAVALEGWTQLDAQLAQVAQAGGDCVSMLRRASLAYRAFAHANPALYALMSTLVFLPTAPDFGPIVQRIMGDFRQMIAPLGIQLAQEVHALRTVRAAVHGFIVLELGGQFGFPESVDASFESMIDTLVAALRLSVSS